MRNQTNRRSEPMPARWRPPSGGCHAVLFALLLTCAAGCPNNNSKIAGGDPLKGEVLPHEAVQAGSPILPSKSAVPPIPDNSTSMSTAEMAALPLDGGKTLNIADPNAQSASADNSSNSPWKANTTNQGNPGAETILGKPQPIEHPQRKEAGNNTTPPGSGIQPSGYTFVKPQAPPRSPSNKVHETIARLEQELEKRNVLWKKMYKTETGVKFVCAVPHPQDPKAERVIESFANDPFAAVQKALITIDRP